MTSGRGTCTSVVANVSEQREFILLEHPIKGGLSCGRGGHFQGHTPRPDKFTVKESGAKV